MADYRARFLLEHIRDLALNPGNLNDPDLAFAIGTIAGLAQRALSGQGVLPIFKLTSPEIWFRILRAKYSQRPQYTEAETHDLAKEIARVIRDIEIIPIACAECGKIIETYWLKGGGMLPGDYFLIADSVFHIDCWDARVESLPPDA